MDVHLRVTIDASSDQSVARAARVLATLCARLHRALDDIARREGEPAEASSQRVAVTIESTPAPARDALPKTSQAASPPVAARERTSSMFTVVPYAPAPTLAPAGMRLARLAESRHDSSRRVRRVADGLIDSARALRHAGRTAVVRVRVPPAPVARAAFHWTAVVAGGLVTGFLLVKSPLWRTSESPATPEAVTAPAAIESNPGVVPTEGGAMRVDRPATPRGTTRPASLRSTDTSSAASVVPAFDDGRPVVGPMYTGSLVVESAPGGASVFVNQQFVGVTPLVLPRVRAGSYAVLVSADGYERWSRAIQVVTNRRTIVAPELRREP